VYILATIKKSEQLNWENKIDKIMIIKALVIPIFTFAASACVVPDKYTVLFLFINNPEKDPKVSISLNAK
jgi:hypothetical protein